VAGHSVHSEGVVFQLPQNLYQSKHTSHQNHQKSLKIIWQDLQKSKPDKLDPNLAVTGSNISLA
jgi:hypothetical protein